MDVGSPSRISSADHRKTWPRTQPLGARGGSARAPAAASSTGSAARPLPKEADRAGDGQRQWRDVPDGGAEDANHEATIEQKDEDEEKKEDKQVRFDQQNMFLGAVADGDTQEVRRLVHAGVDPNTANADGLTALHEACLLNVLMFLLFLLAHVLV